MVWRRSPSFDKDKMTTFERYFIEDKSLSKEKKGYYYELRNEESVCDMILNEFGINDKHSHIINGHIPVKTIKGEKPVKAGGKLLVIDGGFSKAYQSETGIAGYTLIYHSRGYNWLNMNALPVYTKGNQRRDRHHIYQLHS